MIQCASGFRQDLLVRSLLVRWFGAQRDQQEILQPWRETVKQVIAIVKPFLAEKVLESLRRAPLEALMVQEVKGFGRQKSYLDQYGDSEYSQAFLPKVEISLWVDDTRAEEIMRKIVDVAEPDESVTARSSSCRSPSTRRSTLPRGSAKRLDTTEIHSRPLVLPPTAISFR